MSQRVFHPAHSAPVAVKVLIGIPLEALRFAGRVRLNLLQ